MSEEMSRNVGKIDVKMNLPETQFAFTTGTRNGESAGEILGISARTVERRHLQGLQAKGRLIRIGAKGGSWLVK